MKKQMRMALSVGLITLLALLLLSLTVFGAGEIEELSDTTEDGVIKVENAEQLIDIFTNLGSSAYPATSTIKLVNDIDVDGKLTTVQKKVFGGVLDGNGKTISGITQPLFVQLKGTVKNLTLRGKDGATLDSATLALKAIDATATGVVSYANVQAKDTDSYAGGLFAYAEGKVTLTNCAYYGELKADWKQNDLALGGLVGQINPNGQKANVIGGLFGGKVSISGGANGKKSMVGGILGQLVQGALTVNDCASVGTLTSAVTAGTDYLGGIIGLNESSQISLEHCANKGDITAVKNAGGIFGGISVASKVMNCTNFGKLIGETVGAFCGNGGKVNLSCFSSYDFAEGNQKFCGTNFSSNSTYAKGDITFEKAFTLGSTEYEKYDRCTIDKATGLTVVPLRTTKMFEAFVSTRDDGDKQAFRFVILSNETCEAASVTVSVKFMDMGGNTIKSYTGILGGKDTNLTLYKSVAAAGENYFAAEGCAIFGCVITEVPVGMWDSVELTVTDTADGTVYLEPVELDGYSEILTMEALPDFSSLGTVSELYNCGPGLMSDQNGTTEEDSFMAVISQTTKEKFEAYVDGLDDAGFSFVSKTTVDGDDYYTYSKFGRLLYLYYNERIEEIRIITDNSSDPLFRMTDAEPYQAKEGEKAEFYQYSINYSSHDKEGYDPVDYTEGGGLDCGMLYMMKTADNRIIMIDGGHSGQLSANAKKYLYNYMREITGTPAGEKVTIASWFFTHPHGDHVAAARDFLNTYYNQINLESVIYNFPAYETLPGDYDGNTFGLKDALRTHYPNTYYHKLHTGEILDFGGIRMEVVYTHEDAVTAKGISELYEMNSASTVVKITIDNKVFMMLGDVYHTGATTMLKMHSKSYLKSDVFQVAHHGYNDMANFYKVINAPIALFSNAMTAKDHSTYNTVMLFSKEAYFAHKWTYKLTVENGAIKVEALKRYDQK